MTKTSVVIGMSGGVDSSVAAFLLKDTHTIQGMFMKNWNAHDEHCPAEQDYQDARQVAETLGIPISAINFVDQYWQKVFQTCLDEFAKGKTPNPDILCNKEIKFTCFLDHAISHGAEKIATGHYANVENRNGVYTLRRAADSNKDQTYFLYRLNQNQLSYCLFPLGDISKPKVRLIAKQQGFDNASKKDSTGICFIGKQAFKPFLSQFFLAKPGPIISDQGENLGQHDGLMFYTLGQRKGLNIGGKANAEELPWYVIDKDLKNNTLIVGQGHEHPSLLHPSLICSDVHWIAGKMPEINKALTAKIRYRQSDQACKVLDLGNGTLQVDFAQHQWAITPGQSIVFYQGEICLGGAIIDKAQGAS